MGARDFFRTVASNIGQRLVRSAAPAPLDNDLRRIVDLAGARILQRNLDVAETPAWTQSWMPSTGSINQDLERGLALAVRRCRDLFKNYDYARGYMWQVRANVFGAKGMRLQMRMLIGTRPNQRANDACETFWRAWGRRGNCEVTGKFSWRQLERLMGDHLVRDGEILMRLLPGRGPFGFQVQLLDPLVLDVAHRGQHEGRRIRMGIELDAENVPAAYWLRASSVDGDYHPTALNEPRRVRVPAAEILHFFIAEEADQLRGMPWLVAGARRLWLAKDFEQAAAVASSNAAKRVGFFVSPNGDGPPGFADQIISAALDEARKAGRSLSQAEITAIVAAAQKFSTAAPGQYDTLPQGYDFKSHDSAFPHVNHGQYLKEQMRGFTAGVGVSYVTGGNNLEAVNYSSARVGIMGEREVWQLIQEDVLDGVHQTVFAHALRYGLLSAPQLAGFNPSRYDEALDSATWTARRWAELDPLKSANADDINLKNRLTSPQRIIRARGEDPDEIEQELREWEERNGPVGGNTSDAQTAAANQPTDSPDAADSTDAADSEDATDAADTARTARTYHLRRVRSHA